MIVVHLILLPVLFGTVFYQVKESYQSQFVEHVRSITPLYAQMIRPEDSEDQLIATLDDILLSGRVIFVEMKTAQGKRVTSSLIGESESFVEDFFFGQHDDDGYYIEVPIITHDGEDIGMLRIGYTEQLTLEQIDKLFYQGVGISAVYLLLSALFVVLSSTVLTRSIRLIGDTSQAIAKGELGHSFAVETSIGEISQLAANLEYMRLMLFQDRQEIKDREARIQAIVDNMAEGVFTTDAQGVIETFNQAAEYIFGYSSDEVIGKNIHILIKNALPLIVKSNFNKAGNTAIKNYSAEKAGLHKTGGSIALEVSISSLSQSGRRVFSGIVRDITEKAKQKALLEYQATHDGLTGLPNRMLCLDRLGQMLHRSRREKITSALFMLDLNLFKAVNDNYGHEYGDELLKLVAVQLKNLVRRSDTVARFGGDEFVILLPEQNEEGAIIVANNILAAIAKPYLIKGQEINIGISIGIAIYPVHGADEKTLMRSADEAMYFSKRHHLGYQLGVPKLG